MVRPIDKSTFRPTGGLAPLPQGIGSLTVQPVAAFGAAAPSIQLKGALNDASRTFNVGAIKIDLVQRTVRVPVSAQLSGPCGTRVPATVPFSKSLSLGQLAGKSGNWQINVVDAQGQICAQATLAMGRAV